MMQRQSLKKPALFTITSFLTLLVIALTTNPANNIAYTMIFFGVALVFLISLGYLVVYLRRGRLGPKGRTRIFILSVGLVLALMFRSAQALNWVDGVIFLLVVAGLIFYSSRRT